ncbi:MAG: phage portal protein [Candidatus Dactylopiibacterium sp.]|nr:phage portal protein [Candidatus Dactylopiibacterium sp.]
MNALDRLIASVAPTMGLRRAQARAVLAMYEGADRTRLRKVHHEARNINDLVKKSAPNLRAQARHLERNHDLARGGIRTFVNNVVGATGIGVEPQPRRLDGTVHEEYAAALTAAHKEWRRRPEVTKRWDWEHCQRLLARRWAVDGEVFAQRLIGPVQYLDHGKPVPYSLELLEADMIPHDFDRDASDGQRNSIRQGIERNAWGEPRAAWVYRYQPDEAIKVLADASQLKRLPWDRILHLMDADRIHQIRGVSMLASIITRLEDIKDYEESERVAAKISAMLTAYVKKGSPDMANPTDTQVDAAGNPVPRQIALSPGMIIDNLGIGEEIGLIDSKRPNPNLITFRQGQLRAGAAGFGISYSSFARDYAGTYSAQRQELVEQWVNYAVLTDDFVGMVSVPTWEDFVRAAHLSGVVPMPKDLKPGTETEALYVAQSMPWIDPLKEAYACAELVKAGFASEVEMIRKRGGNPTDVLEQIATWRRKCAELGVAFTTSTAPEVLQGLLAGQES